MFRVQSLAIKTKHKTQNSRPQNFGCATGPFNSRIRYVTLLYISVVVEPVIKMKRVMIVALLAFLSIILINNVKATASILQVYSNPTGATVLIDDVPRGQTPLNIGLVAGTHVLVLTNDGYVDSKLSVNTVEGTRKIVNVTLTKK